MRKLILSISLLGTIVFGGAFLTSLASPTLIERAAREIIRIELEKKLAERLDELSGSKMVTWGQKALGKNDAEIEAERRAIAQIVPSKVAEVMNAMLDPDCECRKRLSRYVKKAGEERISPLTKIRQNLTMQIETSYASVSKSLLREFRIFTGSNAIAFVLLGIVTLVRRAAALQLALPAIVLVGATLITSSLYLLGQNWLHTIIFGDYVGLAYSIYLGASALFLADVLFNRARVSTELVNGALNAVGSSVSAVAC